MEGDGIGIIAADAPRKPEGRGEGRRRRGGRARGGGNARGGVRAAARTSNTHPGVAMLKEGITRMDPDRPLNVLIEGGEAGGRTGCRSLEEAMQVARAVHDAAPKLALCGVEGYEGLNAGADDETVSRFLHFIVEIAETCDREGLFAADPVLLSAGGSAFFDLVAEEFSKAKLSRPSEIIIRSGCYIAHDSLLYTRAMERVVGRNPELARLGPPPPEAALEVWGYVQSRPERSEERRVGNGRRHRGGTRDVEEGGLLLE